MQKSEAKGIKLESKQHQQNWETNFKLLNFNLGWMQHSSAKIVWTDGIGGKEHLTVLIILDH